MSGEGSGEHPTFTILLPTHNRGDVLPFAIQSVLAQSIQDFELLIVGDGCTDKTADVVGTFHDRRIRWFDLPKGPGFGYENRNVALRQARGRLVAFMAHDDLWLRDHLAVLASCFNDDQIEIAYSRPLWVGVDGTISPGTFNLHDPDTLKVFLTKWNGIPAGCVVHTRECFSKYGYWDATLAAAADWDMWKRIVNGGGQKNVAYHPLPTCLHFRAIWRTELNSGFPHKEAWRRLHATPGALPSALKVAIMPGVTEQETVWRAMAAGPEHWTRDLRQAVVVAIDRRVVRSCELMLEMDSMKESHAWRIVSSLIRWVEAIAPSGSSRERLLSRLKTRLGAL